MNSTTTRHTLLAIGLIALLGAGLARAQTTIYVTPAGNGSGVSWADPTSLTNAVAIAGAGDTVLVTNGTYAVTTNLVVTNFTVRSVNGPDYTTVYRQQTTPTYYAIFNMSHANAFVSGFTITNGWWDATWKGGAVHMTDGTVSNCVMTKNHRDGGSSSANGVLYVFNGLATHCVISNNNPRSAAIYITGTGSTIRDSIITENTVPYDSAGALYLNNGTARRCRIYANDGNHGRVNMTGASALLENCLITENTPLNTGYGAVYLQNGTMRQCTVADNTTGAGSFGSGINRTGGTVVNCIASGNGPNADYAGTIAGVVSYSCAPELSSGLENITADPLFTDAANDDYTLSASSPCIDTGTNLVSVTVDIDGTGRPIDGDGFYAAEYDMGAYEAPLAPTVPFRVTFAATPLSGTGPLQVVFTAETGGTNPVVAWYGWDFDNDGTYETNGAALAVVTNTYSGGIYSVRLVATNTTSQGAARTNLNYVTVYSSGTDVYVSSGGSDTFPYDTWAKSTPSLDDAMNAVNGSGYTVHISNGNYTASSEIALGTDITVYGVNGPDVTSVYGLDSVVFSLSHADATLHGVTISNNTSAVSGGAVNMSDGTVSNCVITEITQTDGSGILYMTGGLATDCVISNNNFRYYTVYMSGGELRDSEIRDHTDAYYNANLYLAGSATARRCRILNNTQTSGTGNRGIWMTASGVTMENCLVAGNTHYSGNNRPMVTMANGTMVHCTVADNTVPAGAPAAGVDRAAGTLQNCIIYTNPGAGGVQYNGTIVGVISYSCAPELSTGTSNITANPLFADAGSGDYSLGTGSPCIDTGTNANITVDIDGTNRPIDGDLSGGAQYDMGCYEAPEPAGGTFEIDFSGTPLSGFTPLEVVFTATLAGTDTNITWYGWDFDNDGTYETNGAGLKVVTNTYDTAGTYSVRVRATNTSSFGASHTNTDYVTPYNEFIYVTPSGSGSGVSWADPTSLTNAVEIAVASQTVLVTNGSYAVYTNLAVDAGFTVRSVNGPDYTTVYRGQPGGSSTYFAIFDISHADGFVSGFTITNGFWLAGGKGGAVTMTDGTVSNCVMTKCDWGSAPSSPSGHGVLYVYGGLVTDCVISNNAPRSGAILIQGTGSVIQDSIITENTVPYDSTGALYLNNGTARRCRIYANDGNHGRVNMTGASALLENCLIRENTPTHTAYGAVYLQNGTMKHCTVADNTTGAGTFGSGINRTGGTVTNCIVSGNTPNDDYYGTIVGVVSYSCAPELSSGTGNITGDPLFEDAANDDYTLSSSSPCIDAGTNANVTVDIDGTNRPINGDGVSGAQYDMGCYEAPEPPPTPFIISLSGTPESGTEPLEVVFTATPGGTNPDVAWYGWDFDNDGTYETNGADLAVVTNIYAGGLYTVRLVATNTTSDGASDTETDYVTVYSSGSDVYVSEGGSATFPYDTWAKSTTNLIDAMTAVNGGGYTVHITNGTYTVSDSVTLDTDITVYGVNGPDVTSVYGLDSVVFSLSHADATLHGVTISNNTSAVSGSAVNMSDGTVSNCVISEITQTDGSGILYMTGGLATDCVISNNNFRYYTVYMSGGELRDSVILDHTDAFYTANLNLVGSATARRCRILDNTQTSGTGKRGVVWLNSASTLLENCLVADNVSVSPSYPSVLLQDGSMVNCTVAGNTVPAGSPASGVDQSAGAITNSIIYGNSGAGGTQYNTTGGTIAYSLAPELTPGAPNYNLNGDPLFEDAAGGDYTLVRGSPAINKGADLDWTKDDLDLAGASRLQCSGVDMGAYEATPPPGSLFIIR